MNLFLDTSAIIYSLEARGERQERAKSWLGKVRQDGSVRLAVSSISWMECRVGPMKNRDWDSLKAIKAFFDRPDLVWVDLTRSVIDLATAIRVRHGLKTPDALHAACCLQLGKDHLFLTGDADFSRVDGLKVLDLNQPLESPQ